MVDEKLLKDLKNKMEQGPESADPSYTLKAFEFFKQLAAENEEIKEMLEDMDVRAQIIVEDINKKFWLIASKGAINYGEGELDNPSITILSTMKVAIGMLYGDFDPVSAYMSGEIVIEGNLPDAMEFNDILDVAMEEFKRLSKDI
ncbi:MAG: SCP2 sterol-binding domain-containing protein [Promethearchaeota archaeon]